MIVILKRRLIMKFNDEVIAHIAKLLQIAILTGTDVVDNLRLVKLQEEDGELYLSEDYSKQTDDSIEKMLNEISTLAK
tara:strand:+ start:3179 stop:3412 length:234 start_codon:yes stop_codon:yes gene_type:complete